jgi:hypothetical protein
MKGERKSQAVAALVFAAVRKLEKPEPLPPIESPMLPGWAFRKQAE